MNRTTSSRRKRWFFSRSLVRAYHEWIETRRRRKSAARIRPLFAEVLEPRVLFSGAPVEPPQEAEPAPEQTPQNAPATLSDDHSAVDLALQKSVSRAAADAASVNAIAAEASLTDVADEALTVVESGDVSPALDQDTLDRLAQAAKQRWIDSGLDPAQLAALESITYRIADLPATQLASANGNVITIDANAWQQGWFTDSTPFDDAEYDDAISATLVRASGGEAASGVDLLSVLMHEQGHILGLEDTLEPDRSGDLMFQGFASGQRRLPADGQALGATPGEHSDGDSAVFAVTTTADGGAGSGSLRDAIIAANAANTDDTISLAAGTYTLSLTGINEESAATGDLDIRNNGTLLITGAGKGLTIIDAAQLDRVFDIFDGATVEFRDLTIRGGFLDYSHGAGFYARFGSTVTLTNVAIDNNTVQTPNTVDQDRHGGGIWANQATITGSGVDITNNTAQKAGVGRNAVGGGAWLSGDSTLTLTDVNLTGNTAREGGGFYISTGNFRGSIVNLTNAAINNNTGVVRAGGFYNAAIDARVTVTNGTISGNTAQFEHGGGFYNYAGSVTLSGVTISGNETQDLDTGDGKRHSGYGGGFFNSAGSVIMTGGDITGNTAYGHGGGFYNRVGTVTIVGTGSNAVEIDNNKAGAHDGSGDSRDGGGFYNTETGTVNLTHSTFSGNNVRFSTAGNSLTVTGLGAGFLNTGESTVNLAHVNISSHIAAEGGAFYQGGVKSRVTGTSVTLDNNTAITRGGAVANRSTGAIVDLTDSFIRGNTARNEHGGGFYNNGRVILTNTEISGNMTLDLDGGVITNLNVAPTTSAGPVQRDGYGAGFFNTGGSVTLTGGSINLNQAYGNGGGFANSGGVVSATGVTINGNAILRDADLHTSSNYNRSGAGFFNESDGRVDLVDVQLTNNALGIDTAGNTRGAGGGGYNSGAIVNISGASIISGNRAEDGGGFYSDSGGSVVTITGTDAAKVQIINNVARVRGGAFRSTGNTTVNLEHVDITGNSAETQRGGAIYADGARLIGSHVRINNNQAGSLGRSGDEEGGALWLDGFAHLDLTDSEITGNRSEVHGGGIYATSATVALTRTTVSDNLASNSGGGIFVNGPGRIDLVDSSITGNIARDNGGGIYATDDSVVTAVRSHLDRNITGYELDGVTRRAADLRGGGFYANGRAQVTLTDSTVDGNVAAMYGGGGYVGSETRINILSSTVAENIGGHHGGAFFVESSGNLSLQNSTVSGNWAGFRLDAGGGTPIYVQESIGGAIWNLGGATTTRLDHVTVTNNKASRTDGAGIHRSSGSIFIENSIIFGNIGNAEGVPTGTTDTHNQMMLIGANVIGSHGGSALTGNTAGRITTDPGLAPLAANGGFGRTHAISTSSSAAGAAVGSTVAIDQTGVGRGAPATVTAPVNIHRTGTELLSEPGFAVPDPDRIPVLNGDSLLYPAGGAAGETLFSYRILPAGEFGNTYPATVTIDLDFTKVTGDQDFVFVLSDGVNNLTWSMNDNNGGEVIFGSQILAAGEPGTGVPSTMRFALTLNAAGTGLVATRGTGQTGTGSVGTRLNPFGGLTFTARLGDAAERTQIDALAVSFSGLTGQEGGTDLGSFEADPPATTLTIDELTVPENLLGGVAASFSATATSTGAGPLTYDWEIHDSLGNLVGSGSGADLALTATALATNPIDRVTVTMTVTDTATGQSATSSRVSTLVTPTVAGLPSGTGIVVDTGDDTVDGDVTSIASLITNKGADGKISLREAIRAANAAGTPAGNVVITFDATVTTATLTNAVAVTDESAAVNGDLDITKTNGTVFLIGNGIGVTTVSGGGIDRVFDIHRASVFLKDLRITGGITTVSDHGAGFRNLGGTVVMQNVDLSGNDATRTSDNVGGGFYSTRSGVLAGRVVMTGGTIGNNFADSHGGGFYVDDANMAEALIYIKNATISGNVASNAVDRTDRDGGGFYFTGTGNRLELDNVIIENNTTIDDGGGFYWGGSAGTANFNNVIIRGNTTLNPTAGTQDSDGAGFGLAGTRNTLTFTNSEIGQIGAGNISESDAGGFKMEGRYNTLNLIDVSISGNSTANGTGGGFWVVNDTETVNLSGDSRIVSNTTPFSGNHGGGFRNDGVVNITGTALNPIELQNNLAGTAATGFLDVIGGAFFNTSNGTVNLTDVIISGNQAYSRGGGFFNNSGGKVFISSSNPGTGPGEFRSMIANNTVVSNDDDAANQSWRFWGAGGGFYQESAGSLVDVTDTVITANSAVDHAGGFFTQSNFSTVNLTRVDITEHQTPDAGAGFFVNSTGSVVNLDTVLIDHNVSTTNHGGGFRNVGIVNGRNVTMTNNAAGIDLAGNSTSAADLVGGAIYNSSGQVHFVDSTISDNYARGRGGAIYSDGGSTIDISSSDPGTFRSTISGNWVDQNSRDGGGLYITSAGNLLRLTGVDLVNNIAGRHGGGFYLSSDAARVELIDVLISGNVAGNVLGTGGQGGGFFNASAFSTVTVDRVTISNNVSKETGAGGFYNRGRVIGTDVVISNNVAGENDQAANNDRNLVAGGFRATGSESITDLTRVIIKDNTAHGRGGGFYSDASSVVTLTDFIITGNNSDQGTNEGQGRGGGFWNSGNADVILNRGEISENESFGHGGGFYQQDTGSSVSATNVTISGNRAGVDRNGSVVHDTIGGGFWAISGITMVTLNHVTITNNQVNRNNADAGAGFRVDSAGNRVRMSNSIVYGNFRQADTATPIADDIDNRTSTNVDFLFEETNIVGVRTGNGIGGTVPLTANPNLGALQNNGGFSRTHALGAGSAALNAATGSTLPVDQRGIARPEGASSDLGAVEGNASPQVVGFTLNQTSVQEGAAVSLSGFGAGGNGGTDAYDVTINWGDGTVEVLNLAAGASRFNARHVYADDDADDAYTVTVSAAGQVAPSLTEIVTVANGTPKITVVGDQSVAEGTVLSLTDLATFIDPGFGAGETFSYSINWGDGSAADSGNATIDTAGSAGTPTSGSIDGSHVFADNGIYTVTVTLADDDGGSVSRTFRVTVTNAAPAGNLSGITANEGAVFTLSALAFNDPGTLDTHTAIIDWGDGGPVETGIVVETPTGPPGSNAGTTITLSNTHLYADNGVYTVRVNLVDDDGGRVEKSFTVTVNNVGPTVTPIANQVVNEGSPLSLTNIATFTDPGFNYPANPNGASVETFVYSINWGDGSAADNGSATVDSIGSAGVPTTGSFDGAHTYAENGVYTVTVTVTDDDGGVGSNTFTVTVNNVAPTANDDGRLVQVWQLGIDNGNIGEFEQEGGVNAAPGSPTVRDDDYYFAGNYGGTMGTVVADEILNDGVTGNSGPGGFERALTNGDPTNRIHFNLSPDLLNDNFRLVIDTISSNIPVGGITLEVLFNGNVIHSQNVTSDGIITTNMFTGVSVGAITGDNVLTLRRTDSNGGWLGFDRLTLEAEPDYIGSYAAVEDTLLTVNRANGVLTNDTDSANTGTQHPNDPVNTTDHFDQLTVTEIQASGSLIARSTLGALVTMAADGSFTYNTSTSAFIQTLAQGETVTDTFTYVVSDGDGGSDTGTVTITVTGTGAIEIDMNLVFPRAAFTTDPGNNAAADTVAVALNGGNLDILVNGTLLRSVPAASLANGSAPHDIRFTGSNDGDTLNLGALGTNLFRNITATGGAGTDAISVTSPFSLTGALSATAESIQLGANVTTAGTQAYTGAVSLSAPVSLQATTLTINGPVTLGANTLTVNVSTGTSAINGGISGTGGLVKQGQGKLDLAGSTGSTGSTYSGTTTVSEGQLHLNNSGGNAVGGNLDITTGGKVTFGRSNQIIDTAAVTMSGAGSTFNGTGVNAGTFNSTETIASFTVTGGAFNTSAGGNWTVTGAASFTGSALAGGTVFVGNSGGQFATGSLSLKDMTSTSGLTDNSFTLFGASNTLISTITVGSGGVTLENSNLNMRQGGGVNLGSQLILAGDITTVGTAASTIRRDAAGGATGVIELRLTGGNTVNTGATANLTVDVSIVDHTATPATLTKTGAGQLSLTGGLENTYSGTTTVNAGTLRLGQTAGVTAVAANILVNAGGTLTLATSNQIADTAGITVSGGTITGWSTDETIAFYTQNAGGLPASGNTGHVVITGTLTLAGGNTLTINSNAGLNPPSWTVGSASLTGTDILIGGNNGAGNPTTKLIIGSGGLNMAGRTITLYGGTSGAEVVLNGDFTGTGTNNIVTGISGAVAPKLVIGSATRTFAVNSGTTTIGMEIAGVGGAITKTGTGTLTLTGANTYTGLTTISTGTLALTGTGEIDESIEIAISAGATFSVSGRSGGGYSYAGEVSGTGAVLGNLTILAGGDIQAGGNLGNDIGTLTVTGNTALAGTFAHQINGGASADLLTANGTVNLTGAILTVEEITAGAPPVGSTILLIANNDSDAVTGTFNGLPEGAIVTDDDGDVYVISYVGGDGNDVVLFAGAAETHVDLTGGVLTISDIGSETADAITISFDGTYYTITDPNAVISTTGLSGVNVIRPDAQTVRVLASAVTGITVITANPTAVGAVDSVTINSLPASLAGAISVSAETINLNTGVTTGTTQTYNGNVVLGTPLTLQATTLTINGPVTFGANTLTVDVSTGTSAINGAVSGTGGLVKQGAGRLDLAGSTGNTYNGVTTVTAGQLHLNNSGGNAIGGNLDITTGGKVTFARNHQIIDTAAVTMSGAGSVFNGTGVNDGQFNVTETIASLTVSGGAFNSAAGGNWTVTGAGSFTGGAGNTIVVGNSGTRLSFGSLALSGMVATAGVNVAAANSFTLYGNSGSIISTITVGSGGLTLDNSRLNLRRGGAGTLGSSLILNGEVTTLGTAASLIMEDTAGGTSGVAVVELSGTAGAVNRTFNVGAGGADLTVNTAISDGEGTPASLIKTGTGRLSFNGVLSNTYSGTTAVSGGTLLVNGTHTGADDYTVGASGTLGGSGTITLATGKSVSVSGSIAPGNAGVGTLTVNGDVSFTSGSKVFIDLSGTANTSDRLAVNGDLDLNGARLFFNEVTAADDSFYTVITYTGTLTGVLTVDSIPTGYAVDYNLPDRIRLIKLAVTETGGADTGESVTIEGFVSATITDVTPAGGAPAGVAAGSSSTSNPATVKGVYGDFIIGSDGSFIYALVDSRVDKLSQGESDTDTFNYSFDYLGSTQTGSITFTVNGTNDIPVLQPDSATVNEGGVGGPDVAILNLLGNDSDVDQQDVLSVTNLTFDGVPFVGSVNGGGAVNPASPTLVDGVYGTLQVNANGTFVYTLNSQLPETRDLTEGQVAIETFTYTVSDGNGGIVTEKIRVTVIGAAGGQIGDYQGIGGSRIMESFRFAERGGFLSEDAEEDGYRPILTLIPTYSGVAAPGSVISIRILSPDGRYLPGGNMTVVADLSGSWNAGFSDLVLGDSPYVIQIEVQAASWDQNAPSVFQTYFAPAISGSYTASENISVNSIFGRRLSSVAMEMLFETNLHPQGSNEDWRSAAGFAETLR